MKSNWKSLLGSIVLPLAVGGAANLLTKDGIRAFSMVVQPAFSPPAWIFPILWTLLYALMGISAYLIKKSAAGEEENRKAFILYYGQLAINFLWPTFFFNFQWYFFSALWLFLLIFFVSEMIKAFGKISKTAAYLNIPYLIWLLFAAYLNLGIWWLNG